MDKTSISLLNRLRSGEDLDWQEFYEMYDQAILAYARKLGLGPDGAYDVLQETMVNMVRILPNFEYNPKRGKFRNFLLTIVHRNCLRTFSRTKKQRELQQKLAPIGITSGPIAGGPIKQEQPESGQKHLWQAALVDQALANIRNDPGTRKKTVDIFTDYAINDMDPGDVAAKYKVAENNVYQIKARLIERLKREVDLLTQEDE